MPPVDLLAIAAHRDDAELTCGGTLIRAAKQGYRTAIVDLTEGERGTRGSREVRAREASRAAEVLGLSARENLGLPDAALENTTASRLRLVAAIRDLTPRVVIAPAPEGRHPDHRVAAQLVRDACFLAGLAKLDAPLPPHRPFKVVHCITYRQDFQKPTFVTDISEEFEQKMEAIRCYGSQFEGVHQAGEVYPTGESLFEVVRHQAAVYGALIRCRFGEPFFTPETMRIDDVVALQVASF